MDPEGFPELLSEPFLGPCEAFNLDFGNLADEKPDEKPDEMPDEMPDEKPDEGDDFDDLDALGDKENESWEDGDWGDGNWEKPYWGDGNLEKPEWGDGSFEKPDWEDILEEKIPVSECPAIEVDPNEAATGPECDEYLCWRNCNEGFEPTYPLKVS